MPDWMGDWTGQLLLFAWALTCALTAFAGWATGWAAGFVRGVRWERSKRQTWLGRERRKSDQPVAVERRAPRVPTGTAEIPMRHPVAPLPEELTRPDPDIVGDLGRS